MSDWLYKARQWYDLRLIKILCNQLNHWWSQNKVAQDNVRRPVILRDGWRDQNGWFFRKFPNSMWPPSLILRKICCNFFSENVQKKACLKVQNLQHKFLDWKWPPPLWNFSENSSVLVLSPVPNSHTCCKTIDLTKVPCHFDFQIFFSSLSLVVTDDTF